MLPNPFSMEKLRVGLDRQAIRKVPIYSLIRLLSSESLRKEVNKPE